MKTKRTRRVASVCSAQFMKCYYVSIKLECAASHDCEPRSAHPPIVSVARARNDRRHVRGIAAIFQHRAVSPATEVVPHAAFATI